MRELIILFTFCLLIFTSCKDDEPEFNASIHITTADASFTDAFEAEATFTLREPNDSFDVEEHYVYGFSYEVGDDISAMLFSVRFPPELFIGCLDVDYVTREEWRADVQKPYFSARGWEYDTVTDLFYLSQDNSVLNEFCITSISENGREVSGTFNLHFVKDPDSRVDPSIWPDTMSITNGTFRAFLHQ
jgi:hypothetical protein